jgi:hypothetical protein
MTSSKLYYASELTPKWKCQAHQSGAVNIQLGYLVAGVAEFLKAIPTEYYTPISAPGWYEKLDQSCDFTILLASVCLFHFFFFGFPFPFILSSCLIHVIFLR